MTQRLISLLRTQALGLLALMLVLTGGAAYAAIAAKNSVVSSSIKNGQVKTVDLKNGAVTTPKLAANAVGSAQVADGSLTGADIADGGVAGADVANNGLTGADVADGTLTGADVNEATLGTVPNADTVDGLSSSAFSKSQVYKKESPLSAGNDLGDGTFNLAVACDPGDILLSGGPANVNGTSEMVESFASPGSLTSWTVRIQKNGFTDNFSVVIQCIDQA